MNTCTCIFTLQHLREATVEAGGTIERVVSMGSLASSPGTVEDVDGGILASPQSKRHKKAEAQRQRLMKQMSDMQKRFYEDHRLELDLLDIEPAPASP